MAKRLTPNAQVDKPESAFYLIFVSPGGIRRMRLSIITLFFTTLMMNAFAEEGFYRVDQFGGAANRLLSTARGAAVLFEMRGNDGRYSPLANGFFISSEGHLLTNHHVGTNCGGRFPSPDYEDRSRALEFPLNRGYLCKDFRARVFPNTPAEVILQLELIARPDQYTIDRGGDFIILHAIGYRPASYVTIGGTRDFPTGTSYYMVGFPPTTSRGNSSVLIRQGYYTDVSVRGDYRIAYGTTVPKPVDYQNRNNPAPYFVGNADGAPGTSGSLIISWSGHFLGYVQGYADRRGIPGSPLCQRNGRPAGPSEYYCGGLINYLRATWVIDRMISLFPNTVLQLK